ncbi:MAG TPA: exopolysaccharide biosynthesis protein [Chthoniobacterales bacterium]|jgi:hypothetical protein|nr:exopolysaccharide biosynthesis protein [Chthoniobacterales bacterium]
MSATVAVPGKPFSEASPSVDGGTKRGPKRARKTGRTAAPVGSRRKSSEAKAAVRRTSDILKKFISDESQQVLTVEQIVKALGPTSFGTSLMVFSIPEVLPIPIPGMTVAVVIPTVIISSQLIRGKREIRLPNALLKRSIPRKAFAAAVRGILPFLERAERGTKARWCWASNPVAKRFLGLFILIMAAVIALPIPFTNMPAAISIFIIALGMVERDGVLISLGILLGLATVAMIGAVGLGVLSLFGVTAV